MGESSVINPCCCICGREDAGFWVNDRSYCSEHFNKIFWNTQRQLAALQRQLDEAQTENKRLREAVECHIKWLQQELGEWLAVESCYYPSNQLLQMKDELMDLEAALAAAKEDK